MIRLNPARGVTLVELLITIAIISILAGTVLFAMTSATEMAREVKTKALIATLHSLLMERYDSYQTRRVPVDTSSLSPKDAALKRLKGIRRLMLLEMPERWNEVDMPDINMDGIPDDLTLLEPLASRPALSLAYQRRYDNNRDPTTNALTPPTPDKQIAECLYLVITLATGDGEAREFFSESDIGDTDGDGAPEFLDGWGRAIGYLRWPAGFAADSPLMTGLPADDHDPFDPLRLDSNAYRLLPLIYSQGPDGDTDLVATGAYPVVSGLLDPYGDADAGNKMGTPLDNDGDGEEWHDNIHSHLIGTK